MRSLITPSPTARATVHCTDMAAQTAPSIWPADRPHPQPVERDEMGDRDGKSREDRDGEDAVRHRDIGEGDERHPERC